MTTPGLITLIGSGETAPSGRALYEPAFDRLTETGEGLDHGDAGGVRTELAARGE